MRTNIHTLEDKVATLQVEVDTAKKIASSVENNSKDSVDKVRQQLESEIQKLKMKHIEELRIVEDRLSNRFLNEKARLEESLVRDIEHLKYKNQTEVEELTLEYQREKQRAEAEIAILLDKLEHKKREIDSLVQAHAEELSAIDLHSNTIHQNMNVNINALNNTIASKQEKITKLTKDLQRLEHQLNRAHKEIDTKANEVKKIPRKIHKNK